jgi:hypothetical protein
MEYIFIHNKPDIVKHVVECGIQVVMIDLEKNGKIERQGHKDTLISNHQISDIKLLKSLNLNCNLMVRTNPYNLNSKQEIDEIISNGADTIMLPMFDSIEQVNKISQYINGRVKLNLLFETPKSLILVDRIISECQFDEAHIGLNDLSIAFGIPFMFELLSSGLVEFVSNKFVDAGIKFGFGGIGTLEKGGLLDPALILSEHVRLKSSRVIISRSFHKNAQSIEELNNKMNFKTEFDRLNVKIEEYLNYNKEKLEKNRLNLIEATNLISNQLAK